MNNNADCSFAIYGRTSMDFDGACEERPFHA